jgi:hypothetical protein
MNTVASTPAYLQVDLKVGGKNPTRVQDGWVETEFEISVRNE